MSVTCQKPCLSVESVGARSYMVLHDSTMNDTSNVNGDFQARNAAGTLLDFRIDTPPVPAGQTGHITIRLKYLGPAPAPGASPALPGAAIPFGSIRFEVTTNGSTGPAQNVPTDCSDD